MASITCAFAPTTKFGLLFRNGLAAGVFALFTGALLTAVWIPSLLHGGLHAWQVFGSGPTRFDGRPAGRQLIDDRDIQNTVERQR